MSSDAFKLQGTIDVDVNEAVSSLKKVDSTVESSGSKMDGFSSKIAGVGKALVAAFSVKAIADFGAKCLNAASDVEEMENKFNVVFDGMTEEVDAWASKFSDSIGRNKNEIKTYLADNQNMFVGMGMTREAGAEMSEQLVSLALDLASFNNLNEADAVEKMSKAIMGETESAKSLGAVLNDNTRALAMEALGMQGKFADLTEAQKMEVNYQAILMQSTDAVGDAERSANSYANQIRSVKAKMEEFVQTLGSYFLPMATNVVTFFGKMVDGAIDFVNGIAEKWTTIGVPIIDNIKSNFSEMGITTDSIMTFVKNVFSNAVEVLKTVWDSVGQPIFNLIIQVIGWVRDAFAERMPQIQAFFSGFITDASNLWNNNLKPCLEAIGNFISNVLAPAFKTVFQGIILPIVDACFRGISNLWSNSLKPILTGVIDFITGVFSGNWSKAWQGIVDMLGGIFGGIVSIVKAPINAVIGLINSAIRGLNSISVDIPDWVPGVGGKTFGVNIPEMSYLENGGILTEPTLIGYGVMAGEKNKGRNGQAEAVIPLTKMWDEIHELGSNIANDTANKSVTVLADILRVLNIIKEKEAVNQTIYEFRDNNFDASETKQTLGQIRFASNF